MTTSIRLTRSISILTSLFGCICSCSRCASRGTWSSCLCGSCLGVFLVCCCSGLCSSCLGISLGGSCLGISLWSSCLGVGLCGSCLGISRWSSCFGVSLCGSRFSISSWFSLSLGIGFLGLRLGISWLSIVFLSFIFLSISRLSFIFLSISWLSFIFLSISCFCRSFFFRLGFCLCGGRFLFRRWLRLYCFYHLGFSFYLSLGLSFCSSFCFCLLDLGFSVNFIFSILFD